MKKLLSIFLVVAILVCTLPLSALTASAASYSGSCGEKLNWSLDTNTGVLIIYGSGDMTDYSKASDVPWYAYHSSIKEIALPEGLTNIGKYAFYDCTGITEITIPNSVESIPQYAFEKCTNLKTVNNYSGLYIVKGSSDYGYVGYYADEINWCCTKPITGSCGEDLTYSFDVQTGALTILGSGDMNNYNYYIGGSTAPWGKYSEVIKEIVLPNGINSIGEYAFYNCTSLKTVNNYSSLPIVKGDRDYGYVAYYADTVNWYYDEPITGGCGTAATWSFDVASKTLTILGKGAMNNYENSYPLIDSYIYDAPWHQFRPLIEKIVVSSGITTIGDFAFYGCGKATEIVISDTVTEISSDGAFEGCYSVEKVIIDSDNNKYHSDGNCIIETASKTLIVGFSNSVIPTNDSVISIGFQAFQNCGKLTEITIPENIQEISVFAFKGCSKLSTVTIKGVMRILDSAFYKCENLKTVNNYTGLTISKGDTSHGYIGYYADVINRYNPLGRCGENLTYVFDLESGVLTISGNGDMADFEFLYNIYDYNTPWYLFRDSIKEVVLSDGVTSIGENAFYDCINLTKAVLPDSITKINDFAFANCSNLTMYIDNNIYLKNYAEQNNISYEEILTNGHSLIHVDAKSPTCTEIGWSAYDYCGICDYTTYTEIPANGHSLIYVDAKSPTCTEIGWNAYEYCSVCDYTTYAELAVIEHNIISVPKVFAGCETDGYKAHEKCTNCGALYIDGEVVEVSSIIIKAFGHELSTVPKEPASCENLGYREHKKCDVCEKLFVGENEVDLEDISISATGHNKGDTIVENNIAPTCTQKGSYDNVVYCTVCDEELSRENVVVDEKGHSLLQVDAKAPTCTDIGWNAYEHCTVCDYTTYVEIAANGHNEGDVVVENNIAPTCTEKGSYDNVVYCTVCNEELSRENVVVNENGHTAADAVIENNVDPTCTQKGSYDNVVYCTVCAEELSRENVVVNENGHSLVYVDAKAPTKKEIGWEAYEYCTACDYTTYVEIPMITGVWKGSNAKGWWYEYSDGSYSIGWDEIDSTWYYFDAKGWMQTGWKQIGRTWYYFKSSGAMVTDWQKIGGVWYFFKESGAMVTGWLEDIDGTWYYFNSSGAMQTGWEKVGNTWYYFNTSGAMKTGWLKLSGTWYYFTGSGAMVTGNRNIGGKAYRFNASGACLNP